MRVQVFLPTTGLRWIQSSRSDAMPPVLQQCFIDQENGDQDWRVVPIVYYEPAAAEIGKATATAGEGGKA